MTIIRKIGIILFIISVNSCAPIETQRIKLNELENLKLSLVSNKNYNSYLALEYLDFSKRLYAIGKLDKSEYFAMKGIRAANYENIVPENPINWDKSRGNLDELIAMQKRLEKVIIPHNLTHLPIQLAHLFYSYDCWVSEELNSGLADFEATTCKKVFYKLLSEIETYLENLHKKDFPTTKLDEIKFEEVNIYFDHNSYRLTQDSVETIAELIKYLTSLNDKFRVIVVGKADRTGSKLYNKILSGKRVEVVKKLLTKNGLHQDLIQVESYGEFFPDIITDNGIQNQNNRAVVIYIIKSETIEYVKENIPLLHIQNVIYNEKIKKSKEKRSKK